MMTSGIVLNNGCTEKHECTLEPKLSREAQLILLLKEKKHIEHGIQASESSTGSCPSHNRQAFHTQ